MDHHGKEGVDSHFSLMKLTGDIGKKLEHVHDHHTPRTVRKPSWTYENNSELAPSFSLRFLHKPSRLGEMLRKASDTTRENSVWNAKICREEHEKVMREHMGREGGHIGIKEKFAHKKSNPHNTHETISSESNISNDTSNSQSNHNSESNNSSDESNTFTNKFKKATNIIPSSMSPYIAASNEKCTKSLENEKSTEISKSQEIGDENANDEAIAVHDHHKPHHFAKHPKLGISIPLSPHNKSEKKHGRVEKNGVGGEDQQDNTDREENVCGEQQTQNVGENEEFKKGDLNEEELGDKEKLEANEELEANGEMEGNGELEKDLEKDLKNDLEVTSGDPLSSYDDYVSPDPEDPLSPAQHPTDPPLDFGYKLVRKKSGEILKSSLKMSGWGKSQSLPSTPTYKQVHFGCLNDVRYFKEKDKPAALSALNSPCASDDDDYDDDEEAATLHNDTFSLYPYQQDSWQLKMLDFPPLSYPAKINANAPVFLERVFISMDKRFVMGHIAVRNIAFEKSICVRYSPDQLWLCIVEIPTTYVPDSPGILKEHNYDRFLFQIPLDSLFASSDCNEQEDRKDCTVRTRRYHFCIKYNALSQEFWDNNNEKNYTVELVKTTKIQDHVVSNKQIRAHTAKPKYSSLYLRRRVSDSSIPLSPSHPELTPPTLASLGQKMTPGFFLRDLSVTDYLHDDIEDGDFVKNNYYLSLPLLAGLYGPTKKDSGVAPQPKQFGNVSAPEHKPMPSTDLGSSVNNPQLYKELLDNYCFFLTKKEDQGPPYAVSSFLVE